MNQKDFKESELNGKLLFSQIVLGDKNAFTEAYYQYNKLLYTVAYKYLMNEELAQDTVQHVFSKLWESRDSIVISTSLKNYLFTMTKNHILNTIRNQNTALQKNYEIAQTSESIEDNLIKKIEQSEMYEHFYAAIEDLPTNKREICLMKIKEELSNQEIADKMQLSVNTVKTHYSESIKLLRKSLSHLIFLITTITFLS
ncbi:MAG: RNA polymerase sigma-70 factor [Bacteroidales bacterium]